MNFPIVCNHERLVIDKPTARDARMALTCKRCKVFDLKAEKLMFRDVRIYRANATDMKACSHMVPKRKREIKAPLDQLDWVELKL